MDVGIAYTTSESHKLLVTHQMCVEGGHEKRGMVIYHYILREYKNGIGFK